jgi:hypothetical protein
LAGRRFRRGTGFGATEHESHRPEANVVEVAQRHATRDPGPAHESPVFASEVLDPRGGTIDHDPGVIPRNRNVVDVNGRRRIPADHVLSLAERDLALTPNQPAAHAGLPGEGRRREVACLRLERVSEPLHRANDAGVPRFVAKGGSQLVHQICEVGLDDEGVGPEGLLNLVLRDGVGPAQHEQLEKLKRLRRQHDLLGGPEGLSGAQIQDVFAEADAH